MDFSSFADDDFDLQQWANRTLQLARSPDAPIEVSVSTLVLKLQFLAADMNSNLREASARALTTLPRSIRNVDKVRKDAQNLQSQMDVWSKNLDAIESTTGGSSLELLSTLDGIKGAMEASANILAEAERLKTLADEIDKIFDTKDLKKIATQLRSMQHSANVLNGLSQFQDYQRTLMLLQDRLEGMARPQVLACFNKHDTESTQNFVEVFDAIGRRSQLMQHYYLCRVVPAEQQWASFNAQYPPHNRPAGAFSSWLPAFYDSVLVLLSQERPWVRQVFGEDRTILPNLLTVMLTSLQHDHIARIKHIVDPLTAAAANSAKDKEKEDAQHSTSNRELGGPGDPVQHVTTLFSITSNFYHSVRGVLGLDEVDKTLQRDVTRAVFAPYFPFQSNYAALERPILLSQLDSLELSASGYTETLRRMGESIPRLFILAESAVERCLLFTQLAEAETLIKILADLFTSYLHHLMSLLSQLRAMIKLEAATPLNPALRVGDSAGYAGNTRAIAAAVAASPSTALPDVASSVTGVAGVAQQAALFNDWGKVEGGLQLLTATAKLQDAIMNFTRTLRSTLLDNIPPLFGANFSPLNPVREDIASVHLSEEPEKAKRLYLLHQTLSEGDLSMAGMTHLVPTFVGQAHAFVYDGMFQPIQQLLLSLPDLPIWKEEGARAVQVRQFYSPQPYITTIGENLLTLLQQLEPLEQSWPQLAPNVAIPLPPPSLIPQDPWRDASEASPPQEQEGTDFAFAWVKAVAAGTMILYIDTITKMAHISISQAQQLATDIKYLCNILSALGVDPNPNLLATSQLLSVEPPEFKSLIEGWEGKQFQLARAIAQCRDIPL